MSENENVKPKSKTVIANEIIKKYAQPIETNGVTPNFKIKDNNAIVLTSGKEISSETLEVFYWKLKDMVRNPKVFPLNFAEVLLSKLFIMVFSVWVILTGVQILGGAVVIPILTGFLGVIPVMLAWSASTFYFYDESVIKRKRKQVFDNILGEDSDFVIAALYNNWSDKKTLTQEREVLGKATYKQDKIYLVGGLTILSEDLGKFLTKMNWLDK